MSAPTIHVVPMCAVVVRDRAGETAGSSSSSKGQCHVTNNLSMIVWIDKRLEYKKKGASERHPN